MKKVSIVGNGRFGKVLVRLLGNDFDIRTFNSKNKNIAEIYEREIVFYAVPIEVFEKVIKSHKKYFSEKHLLIDVLSVKMHPKKIFTKYLKDPKIQAILTHPMFGPDSSKNGFAGLPIIMDQYKASNTNYVFWKKYFSGKKLKVIEMSAREHDRLAAKSQGLTHVVGRLLDEYGLEPGSIDSLGTKKLLEVKEQTCNDTRQLFNNLQHYNPYTKQMRLRLKKSFDKLYNQLNEDEKNQAGIV